jgi:hypothetical protein
MSTIADFRAAFYALPDKQLREMFELCLADAKTKSPQSATPVEGSIEFTRPSGRYWLDFGRMPTPSGVIKKGELSKTVFYRALFTTDSSGNVINFKLDLFLMNPRIMLARENFHPAQYDPSLKSFTKISTGLATQSIGVEFIQKDDGNSTLLQTLLHNLPVDVGIGLPNYQDFDVASTLGRLDLSMSWDNQTIVTGVTIYDVLGRAICKPDIKIPTDNIQSSHSRFYSPDLPDNFDAMLHESNRVAIRLDDEIGFALVNELTKDVDNPFYDTALNLRREFGLSEDFKGLLLKNLSAHWLSGDGLHPDNVVVNVNHSALALSGKTTDGMDHDAKWYSNIDVTMNFHREKAMLGLLQPSVTFKLRIDEGKIALAAVSGQFLEKEELPAYLEKLEKRHVTLSLIHYFWKDTAGVEQVGWASELALESDGSRVLARYDTPPSPVAEALLLSPIIHATNALEKNAAPPALDAKSRGYYTELVKNADLLNLGGALALANMWSINPFPIEATLLEITGAYLREQPTALNNPGASPAQIDIAILFDYNIDYTVTLDKYGGPKLETKSEVSSAIEGNGFVFRNDGSGLQGTQFAWVQVPTGLYELSMSDPGLWEIEGMGKILKVSEVLIRKRNPIEMVIKMKLAGNFGIVKADDFVFVLSTDPGAPLKVTAYPTSVEVDLKNVVKGKGFVDIQKDASGNADVIGSVDLVLAKSGLRMFAGLRFAPVENVTAILAGAEVGFPQPLPLFSTGLGVKALSALFAMHFARVEGPQVGAIPPELQWLQEAGGTVARSVAKRNLWEPEYDRWSFGVGAELELIANPKLLNINGMLVVDIPGPVISIFSKLNMLLPPKSNATKALANEVTIGTLGILQLDFKNKSLTLAAIVDLNLDKLARIRAPIEFFLKFNDLSQWHFYLGHFATPVTVALELGSMPKIDAELYLMAAGHAITGLPGPGASTLPGFALAFGLSAHMRLGSGKLYLDVDFDAAVKISMSQDLYMSGYLALSGELHLWKVSIGASGSFFIEYLKINPVPTNQIRVDGEICGRVKLGFIKLQGCVSLSFGNSIAPNLTLPDLVESVSLVAGSDQAIFGQGDGGPIDALLGKVDKSGLGDLPIVPIDSIIALDMISPPAINGGDPLLAGLAPSAAITQFNMGGVTGQYSLQNVTLQKVGGAAIPLVASDCSWWRTSQATQGGQPAPLQLALRNRNPFSAQNVIIAEDALDALSGGVLGNVCGPPIAEQPGIYPFEPKHVGRNGHWLLSGKRCQDDPQRYALKPLDINVETDRSDLDFRYIQLADVQRFNIGDSIEVLSINHYPVQSSKTEPSTKPSTKLSLALDKFAPKRRVDILLALPLSSEKIRQLQRRMTFFGESEDKRQIEQLRPVAIADIPQAIEISQCERWRDLCKRFLSLGSLPQFAKHQFVVVTLIPESPQIGRISTNIIDWLDSTKEIQQILCGGFAITSSYEVDNVSQQNAIQASQRDAVAKVFDPAPMPLLEPASRYRVTAKYNKIANGVSSDRSQEFYFTTDKNPPRKLSPYLIGTFPMSAYNYHYYEDKTGLVLASDHILRVLAKHNAQMKVFITNASGGAVEAYKSTVNWQSGVVIDPAHLINPSRPLPDGMDQMEPVANVPNALQHSLMQQVTHGRMGCVTLPSEDDEKRKSALWMGFDVKLEPLSRYTVRILLCKADGTELDWSDLAADPLVPASQIFFELMFGTSNFRDTKQHAAALSSQYPRHRRILNGMTPAFPPGIVHPQYEVLTDKQLEDIIAALIGERPHRSDDADVTVCWEKDANSLRPVLVYLETNEPLLRQTLTPSREKLNEALSNPITLVQQKIHAYCFPGAANKSVVERLIVSEGGCRMVAILAKNRDLTLPVVIELHEELLARVPRAMQPPRQAIQIDPKSLQPRPAKL